MASLRVGLIGIGGAAQISHLPAWEKVECAKIVALCDIDERKLQWAGNRFKIKNCFTSYKDLLAVKEVDAVDICVPTNLHNQIAVDALKAGKHVLVERPIARNVAEAESMVKTAKRYKKQLMVGMNARFSDDFLFLKNIINANELGNIYSCRISWLYKKRNTRDLAAIANKEVSGGGVLMDLGIQALDIGLWLLGNQPVETVSAQTFNDNLKFDVEDTAMVFLRLQDGKALSIKSSWSFFSDKDYIYANVLGTLGSASINPLRINKEIQGKLMNVAPMSDSSLSNIYKKSFLNEIRHFANCLVYGGEMVSTGIVHLERMRIIEAIYQSAASGREVVLA